MTTVSRNLPALLLALVCVQPAHATVFSRSAVIDLGALASGSLPGSSFGTDPATFAPATLGVGDQLVLDMAFAGGSSLQVAEDGGATEFLQWQLGFTGPNGIWDSTFTFTGVSGSLLTHSFSAGFSGSWGPFPVDNLTDSAFSFSGTTLTVDISSLTAGPSVTFESVRLLGNSSDFSVLTAVPAPATLPLVGAGLLALACARRRRSGSRATPAA